MHCDICSFRCVLCVVLSASTKTKNLQEPLFPLLFFSFPGGGSGERLHIDVRAPHRNCPQYSFPRYIDPIVGPGYNTQSPPLLNLASSVFPSFPPSNSFCWRLCGCSLPTHFALLLFACFFFLSTSLPSIQSKKTLTPRPRPHFFSFFKKDPEREASCSPTSPFSQTFFFPHCTDAPTHARGLKILSFRPPFCCPCLVYSPSCHGNFHTLLRALLPWRPFWRC